jgi:hypothetical protein
MLQLVLVAALVAAIVSLAGRRHRRRRLVGAAATRAGSSPEAAIAVRRFDEIDEHVSGRWCHCGGYLERRGEGTREEGGRRYRLARLRCQECEAEAVVYFDTTEVLH